MNTISQRLSPAHYPMDVEMTAPSMGRIDMTDLLWQLEEIRRLLAQGEKNHFWETARTESLLERAARAAEVATYRGSLSKVLTLLGAALHTASGVAGFGTPPNNDLKKYERLMEQFKGFASGTDAIKSLDRMSEDGDRTEASSVAQLCGELRRMAEEAKKRSMQEIADALQQLLKILADHGHVVDAMAR
jgi:hypothetical protein